MSVSSPLSQLLDYEKRGRAHIVDLATEEDRREYWRAIAFRVGDVHMLLNEFDVFELLTVPSTAPVPGTKRWVSGIANIRGELLPVVDFSDFLFEQPLERKKQSRVLVIVSGDIRSGLMVDQVFGVKRFPVDTKMEPKVDGMPDVLKTLLSECYEDEQIFHTMSVKRLIEDTDFMQAAA